MKSSVQKILVTILAFVMMFSSACTEIAATQKQTEEKGELNGTLTLTGSTSMADVSNAFVLPPENCTRY